jgi:hypothetical protein
MSLTSYRAAPPRGNLFFDAFQIVVLEQKVNTCRDDSFWAYFGPTTLIERSNACWRSSLDHLIGLAFRPHTLAEFLHGLGLNFPKEIRVAEEF